MTFSNHHLIRLIPVPLENIKHQCTHLLPYSHLFFCWIFITIWLENIRESLLLAVLFSPSVVQYVGDWFSCDAKSRCSWGRQKQSFQPKSDSFNNSMDSAHQASTGIGIHKNEYQRRVAAVTSPQWAQTQREPYLLRPPSSSPLAPPISPPPRGSSPLMKMGIKETALHTL